MEMLHLQCLVLFLSNLGMELMTASQYNIGVKVLILNNSFQGMVRQWQDIFYEERYSGTEMVNPDFVKMAETAAIEGLPCWHGSEVDLGILEVSALHAIAATSLSTIPADIFGELVRQDDLIMNGIVFENGKALVPQGHGLGIELDLKALEKFKNGEIWEAKK